ncbi:hypothetical protein [Chryseobacterium mulctrae]|uniref:hypothetical protein n=1 Tax=Chryseobacterium mulctrae TaxID=2576777 RepID=UPI00111799FE|nr:hypothetical protein [Chryseobacterium mulctrae]
MKKKKNIEVIEINNFQNLICTDPINDSIFVKDVETFILFGNLTNDTIQISIKDIKKHLKHTHKKDTFSINFESENDITIPPLDSLGLPCISIIEKKYVQNDSLFLNGFSVINLKTKKIVSKSKNYRTKKFYEFQLYKRWGIKTDHVDL